MDFLNQNFLNQILSSISPSYQFMTVTAPLLLCALIPLGLYAYAAGYLDGKLSANVSHILVDTREEAQVLLKDIDGDLNKFKLIASNRSMCPSGKTSNGKLGTFRQGDMAPPFEAVVFAASTPVNQVTGPVRTNFGYHIIYIHTRSGTERAQSKIKAKQH